jgi:hypothetical protein
MEQLQATAQYAQRIFIRPPRPGSANDPTAPLLFSPAQREDATGAQQKAQGTSLAMAHVKPSIVMAPLCTAFFSWAILLSAGLDPLAFGMLSFHWVLALLCFSWRYGKPQIPFSSLLSTPSKPATRQTLSLLI